MTKENQIVMEEIGRKCERHNNTCTRKTKNDVRQLHCAGLRVCVFII